MADNFDYKAWAQKTYGLSPNNPHLDALAKWLADPANQGINAPDIMANPERGAALAWEDTTQKGTLAPPATDSRYQNFQQGIIDSAKQFRNNIPQLADTFMGQIAEVNKKNLASEIDQTQKAYNRRGLLNSTARLGAEANDRERSASDLAQKRYDVNTQLNQEAGRFDQNAINAGFGIASQGQQVASADTSMLGQYMDLALKKQSADMQVLSGVGKGLGGAIGYGMGYLNGNSSNGTGGFQTTNPMNYGSELDPKAAGLA